MSHFAGVAHTIIRLSCVELRWHWLIKERKPPHLCRKLAELNKVA